MKIESFRMLAEIHGGDLSRWPAHHQSAAAALTRSDPAAAEILEQALEVDRWLSMAAVDVEDAQVERVMAAIDSRIVNGDISSRRVTAVRPPRDRRFGSAWATGFLIGMGLLGTVVGALMPADTSGSGSGSVASVAVVREEGMTLSGLTSTTGYYSTQYFVDGRR